MFLNPFHAGNAASCWLSRPTRISELFVRIEGDRCCSSGVWSIRARSEEFHFIPVVEKQLKVFCVQAKLTQGTADLPGDCVVRRGSSPSLVSGLMEELEKTAICEKEPGFGEF